MKILLMCVANSARSQLAEGLARVILRPETEIASAGSDPTQLNPYAVEVMREIGVDLSSHYSKRVERSVSTGRLQTQQRMSLFLKQRCSNDSGKLAI